MAVGDIYELTDVQKLFDQQVLNVYFYQQVTAVIPISPTPNVAAVMADEFANSALFTAIRSVQSTALEHQGIYVRNLFDSSDQYDLLGSWFGTSGGAAAITTTFDAVGFRENSNNGSVRDGAKRLAGLEDGTQTDGVIVGAGTLTALAGIANEMEASIFAGVILPIATWEPVVVKRVRSGTPGNYEYRLPENSGELIFGKIIEVLFNVLITSQVSRKVGVGD